MSNGPPPFDDWHAPDPECDGGEWMAREIERNMRKALGAEGNDHGAEARIDPRQSGEMLAAGIR